MKVSLPGLGGIKELLLAHGEKALIAVVAGCVGYMVLLSLGRESLSDDRQADDLQREVSAASSEVQGFTWERAKDEFATEVRLAEPLEQKGEKFVDPGKYRAEHWQIGQNPAVVPPIVRRADPLLLAVADVEATGSSGLLAFTNEQIRNQRLLAAQMKLQQQANQQKKETEAAREDDGGRNPGGRGGRGGRDGGPDGREPVDPEHPNRRPATGYGRSVGVQQAGDEEVKVTYWAVVVAKVPIKEQIKLYQDAFANSLGYSEQADFPQYLGYLVERAEVRPGVDDKDLKWEKVIVSNGKGVPIGPPGLVTVKTIYGQAGAAANETVVPGVVTDWAESGAPETVDPRYLDPSGTLAFPLPPLVGRDWGREATHSEIPLEIDGVELPSETAAADPAAPADAEDADMFSGAADGAGGGRQPGGRGGGMSRGGRMGGDYEGGYGGRGGDMRGGGEGGRGYAGGRGGMGAEGMPQVPSWLLRFFDFSVQPGKKYKYRVQLALLDPNQTSGSRFVSANWLDGKALDRVKADKAARGNKTPVRKTDWSEPSRTVSIPLAGNVHVASAKPPVEQSFTDEPRASLLVESFSADENGKAIQGAKQFEDFRRGYVANRNSEAEALVTGDEGQQFIDKIKDFQFRTGITVLDVRGGERLGGRDSQRPARVLLMDSAGQLFVQNELDDAEAIELHEAVFAEDSENNRGGGGGGRGFEGEFGGRGGPVPGRGGR